MTEQESILHYSWQIIWLEQQKEKLWQEYIDKVAAINFEIEALKKRTSNATVMANKVSEEVSGDEQTD